MAVRPLVLLSNDDGVGAPGILMLREALMRFADVVVVAPETEQSANSHSLTLARPLRHRELDPGTHALDGTPADCIYVALFEKRFLPRPPSLVVSGMNHGLNLGTDVYYSGTVAAAREGALRGVPAIAFSLERGGDRPLATQVAASMAERLIGAAQPEGSPVLLNVNFPKGELKGVRATRLGRRYYDDVVEVRRDPRGREYFWVGGPGTRHDPIEGSDTEAIDAGCASVTPLVLETTSADHLGIAAWVAVVDMEKK